MKVAVVTAATNTIPRFRIDMIDEFVRRGADVVVFGDEEPGKWQGYFKEHEVEYRTYPVSRNGLNPLKDLETKKRLLDLFREEHPDKVFTYQAKPNIYGAMAAHKAEIRDIYVMMGGLGSVFRASDVKSRLIKTIVGAEYKVALARARSVFFQNEEDVDLFVSGQIVSRDKVVMTRGSGVSLSHFPACPLPQEMSFLFVGRLVRGKGVLDYLEAARIIKRDYPRVKFSLVGPFDTNPTALSPEDIRPYIDDGIVVYHGEQKDVQPFQASSSCFVLPSYYGEGTPKSALEAMATGRALIVADAVGCREVVREGENGFLVPPKDPEAIAHAMRCLLNDQALLSHMGHASRKMAEDLFDVNKVNDVICRAMNI